MAKWKIGAESINHVKKSCWQAWMNWNYWNPIRRLPKEAWNEMRRVDKPESLSDSFSLLNDVVRQRADEKAKNLVTQSADGASCFNDDLEIRSFSCALCRLRRISGRRNSRFHDVWTAVGLKIYLGGEVIWKMGEISARLEPPAVENCSHVVFQDLHCFDGFYSAGLHLVGLKHFCGFEGFFRLFSAY